MRDFCLSSPFDPGTATSVWVRTLSSSIAAATFTPSRPFDTTFNPQSPHSLLIVDGICRRSSCFACSEPVSTPERQRQRVVPGHGSGIRKTGRPCSSPGPLRFARRQERMEQAERARGGVGVTRAVEPLANAHALKQWVPSVISPSLPPSLTGEKNKPSCDPVITGVCRQEWG